MFRRILSFSRLPFVSTIGFAQWNELGSPVLHTCKVNSKMGIQQWSEDIILVNLPRRPQPHEELQGAGAASSRPFYPSNAQNPNNMFRKPLIRHGPIRGAGRVMCSIEHWRTRPNAADLLIRASESGR
jgi:hypothetical protein